MILIEIIMIIMSTERKTMNLKVKTPTTVIKMIIKAGIIITIKEMIIKKITIQVVIMAIKLKGNAM